MAGNRMNVLIYTGHGCTVEAVKHCVYSLRRLLSPNYAVISISGDAILKEPWTASCALLVFPGGADRGYCHKLNGEGNRRIAQYVARGGAYLGFCAGAYYGSKRCEFEKGNKELEVVGDRELAFYPGICRGLAFAGFVYGSEAGTHAVQLKVSQEQFKEDYVPESFRCYYNGGGVFVDAPKLKDQGIEILASYTEELHVDPGQGSAAVVYCKVDEGAAILSNTHPEFAAINLNREIKIPGYSNIIAALTGDDEKRSSFLTACLLKLGLQVNQDDKTVPSLSRLHLSTNSPPDLAEFMRSLREVMTIHDGEEYLKDENDTFHFEKPSAWAFSAMTNALSAVTGASTDEDSPEDDRDIDYNAIIKRVIVHEKDLPVGKETPYFMHDIFYSNLNHYASQAGEKEILFGKILFYGDVVTSTNTMLEKNQQLLHRLPTGFVATANVQVAGRGRGSNVWVSPAGSLMFSAVIRHSRDLMSRAPVNFIQYLAAIAIVEGIKTYDTGYSQMPVKLKWPNDIYATPPGSANPVKIGGILVNSHYTNAEFLCVVGIGLNTTNRAPTTSLNALNPPAPFTLEKLLARILITFQSIYTRFLRTGFDKVFETMYYQHWLHTDQIVTLEAEGGVRAKIKGITTDWGLLIAEELNSYDEGTGKIWSLQTDSNSFDFFKGLVRRKF